MRLGIASSIPWLPGKDQEQCFQEALDEVDAAERLGFDSVWFTEHHFREEIDFVADFEMAFGKPPPPLAYLAISGDSDDRSGRMSAIIADIAFAG